MRGLAEFIMAGRRQAITVAVLLGFVPLLNLLSPVVVGLVLLRKGSGEALVLMAWVVLPLGFWAYLGDVVPLIMLLGISGLALLLRETESWEYTLLAAVLVGLGVEGWLRYQPAVLDLMFQQLEVYMTPSNLQGVQIEEIRAVLPTLIGAVYMFLAVTLLIIARWLQAMLYNPGGFRQEFQSLRLGNKVALVLVMLMLLANFGVLVPETWVVYLVIPPLFAGLALVHGLAEIRRLSRLWLLLFYAVLMLPIMLQILILAALVDSWYDFRKRVQAPN